MQQGAGIFYTNQSTEKRNIFFLPKDVVCPRHKNQKIEWINLSKNCEYRLYCNLCQRPQDQYIFLHQDIFKQFWPDKAWNLTAGLVGELSKARRILITQIEQIQFLLQELNNIYMEQMDPYLFHSLTHPCSEFNYEKLQQVSEYLSQKIIFQNDSFSFIPEVSPEHYNQLEKLHQCIQIFQKCILQVEEISPFTKNQTFDLFLCRSLQIRYQQILQAPQYEFAIQKEIELEISTFELSHSFIAVAGVKDKINHQIQIWDFDQHNLKIPNLLLVLQGHRSQIIHLKISEESIISIDLQSVIIFWVRQDIHRYWFLGRLFNAQMQLINCLQYDFHNNLLILGGEYLQLWKLNNSNHIDPINLIESNSSKFQGQITCMNLNKKKQKLVSGDTNGMIYIFEEINSKWELSYELKASQQSIRHIGFTSEDDFVSISLRSLFTKWKYFPETGYDSSQIQEDNLDEAIFIEERALMIKPFVVKSDQIKLHIQSSELTSLLNNGIYLAQSKNKTIRIYILCSNQ